MFAASATAFSELLPEAIGVGPGAGQQLLGVHAGLREELAGFLLGPLQLLARLARVVDGRGDRLLTIVERLEQRHPGELAQRPGKHEERRDRPEVQPRIDCDEWILHGGRPFSRASRGAVVRRADASLLRQDDEQAGHDRQNRHAFEQEERQVRGARDLRRRAWLPRDALGRAGGELTDADARADDGESERRVPRLHTPSQPMELCGLTRLPAFESP